MGPRLTMLIMSRHKEGQSPWPRPRCDHPNAAAHVAAALCTCLAYSPVIHLRLTVQKAMLLFFSSPRPSRGPSGGGVATAFGARFS
ncbi:hypothetical protein FH972_024220 [Carpinus fangiana]|uniref:Uncharacterized protein n=1 Tax=Carpinus fangiana TaxID=176857 RepID=A0A5N6KXF2_9ROSI|nr:hypothetical protein FH972_024220 [Carpinus fangiana]